jgi:hypothetical protein
MKTKPMEDFFNLPPSNETEADVVLPSKTRETLMVEAQEIYSALSTAEKVDFALPTVIGLEAHDSEMDDIAAKAVRTFEDLISLGGNVPDIHAGKIYEVAGQMLKTALDAKNSKAERKLKMIDLQLKKVKAEQSDYENGNKRTGGAGTEFDRNDLLKYIVSGKSNDSDK